METATSSVFCCLAMLGSKPLGCAIRWTALGPMCLGTGVTGHAQPYLHNQESGGTLKPLTDLFGHQLPWVKTPLLQMHGGNITDPGITIPAHEEKGAISQVGNQR